MVHQLPDPSAGRFSTQAECQAYCQHHPDGMLSYDCVNGSHGKKCIERHDGNGKYKSKARCQAYCQHHPDGILSYDCVRGRHGNQCIERHDGNGFYKSKTDCNAQCGNDSLFSYQCTKPSGDYGMYTCNRVNLPADNRSGRFQTMAECHQACQSFNLKTGYVCVKGSRLGHSRCKKVAGIPTHDGSNGIYTTEAQCENSTTTQCGALPVTGVGWECAYGSRAGYSKCEKVNKIPTPDGSNGVFTSEYLCENSKNNVCGALPVNLMTEPNWAIGTVESNPLTQIMSNVGDSRDYIQNYMGSQQQNTYYHRK